MTRLAAIQHEHPADPRGEVPDLLDRAARAVEGGGIAVLPEYFYRPGGDPVEAAPEAADFVREAVLEASRGTAGALVATVPERDGDRFYNTAIAAEDGEVRLEQRKLAPTDAERRAGVEAGRELASAQVQGLELGVLVCADVLRLDLVARMAELGPDVVAVPVLSPNRSGDETREARTSVFVARAWDLGAYVVKAGGHSEPDVAGRSLVTAPWGVMARASEDFASTIPSAPFEADRLRAAREPFEALRDRGGT